MVETLFALTTDEKVRTSQAVESHLSQELSAGQPWFDITELE